MSEQTSLEIDAGNFMKARASVKDESVQANRETQVACRNLLVADRLIKPGEIANPFLYEHALLRLREQGKLPAAPPPSAAETQAAQDRARKGVLFSDEVAHSDEAFARQQSERASTDRMIAQSDPLKRSQLREADKKLEDIIFEKHGRRISGVQLEAAKADLRRKASEQEQAFGFRNESEVVYAKLSDGREVKSHSKPPKFKKQPASLTRICVKSWERRGNYNVTFERGNKEVEHRETRKECGGKSG